MWLPSSIIINSTGPFASRARRELNVEQLVSPYPELGLVAANGPNDPEPELVVENGVVVRLDGREVAEFDVIDRFVVAHGLDLDIAAEAMALADLELARRLVDVTAGQVGAFLEDKSADLSTETLNHLRGYPPPKRAAHRRRGV